MTIDDFTPETVGKKILEYLTTEYEFSFHELGPLTDYSRVTKTYDITLAPVEEIDSMLLVSGQAMLEIETDQGSPPITHENYPINFGFHFDDCGNIISRTKLDIDSSSFYDGISEELDEYIVEMAPLHLDAFERSMTDIVSLLGDPIGSARPCLHKLLFVNAITILESFLSDFFITRVKNDEALLRRLIETTPKFQQERITLRDVFKARETIDKRANAYLANEIVWHRIDHVAPLYERVIGIVFPSHTRAEVETAIKIRHELVHRNGRKEDGTERVISENDIRSKAMKPVEELIREIEHQWSKIGGWRTLRFPTRSRN